MAIRGHGDVSSRFGGGGGSSSSMACLIMYCSTMKMKAAVSSKTGRCQAGISVDYSEVVHGFT
jgi:hypothetical protein